MLLLSITLRFIFYPHPRFSKHCYRSRYANPYRAFYTLSCGFRVIVAWKRGRVQRTKSSMFQALDSYHKNAPIMELMLETCLFPRNYFSRSIPVDVITYSRMLPKATISRKFFSSFFSATR